MQLETALAERENDVLELQEERGELVSALEELRQLTDTGDLEMFEVHAGMFRGGTQSAIARDVVWCSSELSSCFRDLSCSSRHRPCRARSRRSRRRCGTSRRGRTRRCAIRGPRAPPSDGTRWNNAPARPKEVQRPRMTS